MILPGNIAVFNCIPPAAVKDNAAFTSYVLDTADPLFAGAKGILFLVTLGALDIGVTVLKVNQSETKSNATTLSGTITALYDTVTKPSATDDNGIWAIYIDLTQPHGRYLQLPATADDGSVGVYLSAVAIVDRPTNSGGSTLPGATVFEQG